MDIDEIQKKWLKKSLGVEEEKPTVTVESLREKYTKTGMEVPAEFGYVDPARPSFLKTMFREPIELGKTIAMTPGAISQVEEMYQKRSEMFDLLEKKWRSGEISIDQLKNFYKIMGATPKLPEGMTKTTKQIVGDVFGTLLWATPVPEVKAIKGASWAMRFARGAALGGSFATAYGLSENADNEELAERIGLGVALGGPLEVAAPVIFRGVGKILRKTGSLIKRGVNPIWERLAPTAYRLEKLGPAGKKIVRNLYAMDENFGMKAGGRMEKLEAAGMFKISKSQSYAIKDALQGKIKSKALNKKTRSIFQVVKSALDDIADDAAKVIKGFRKRKYYYPQQLYDINILGKKGGKIREEILDNALRVGRFKTKADAEIVLDSWVKYVQTGGRQGKYWLRYLVRDGQAKSIKSAQKLSNDFLEMVGMRTRYGTGVRFAKYGHLEFPRKLNFPFYDPDIRRTIPLYVLGATNRIEQIKSLGMRGEKFNRLIGELNVYLQKEGRTADIPKLRRLVDTLFPVIQEAPDKQKIGLFLRAIQTPKLAFAQMLNIGQSINTFLATDLPSVSKGIRLAFTNKGHQQALRSGAVLDSTLREMRNVVGGELAFSNWFLKWTGFSWTEKFNRTVASNAGMQYVLRLQTKLRRNPTNKAVISQLQELGFSAAEILRKDLTEEQLLRAGVRISNLTQFRARALDLPRFASSAEGKVIFQFKNFVYNQTLFLKKMVVDEFRKKQIGKGARALFILGTVFPMSGEVLGDVRSLVTGSKRPTRLLDRYLEDIAMVGGTGIFIDVIQSAKYGRFADFIIGPTGGMVTSIMERLTKIISTGKVTDADIRWLGQQAGPARFLTNYLFPYESPLRKTILEQLKEEW